MSDITFSFSDFNFYSTILSGGVKVQMAFASKNPIRVVLETRLSHDHAWVIQRNFTANGSLLVSITRFADGQQFRFRTATRPTIAQAAPISSGSSLTDEEFNELSNRIADLEEGNEPLVLYINPETGNLEQEGISSGSFGIDQEAGTLFFES